MTTRSRRGFATARTYRALLSAVRECGLRLFQVRAKHEDACRNDEMSSVYRAVEEVHEVKRLPNQSIAESDSWRTSFENRASQLPVSRPRQVHLLPPVFFVTL